MHLRHITNATWGARGEWKLIGRELAGDIDAIDANYHNADDKYKAVLREWMHTGKARTDQLIDALRSPTVKRADIADMITASTGERRKNLGLL